MGTVLLARGLAVSFGRLPVLDDMHLELARGERHAVIGPNGAGKTTLVNILSGVLRPDRGVVLLDGQDVTRLDTAQRVKRGLVRTFQVNSLFPDFTVHASLVLAICERDGLGGQWWKALRAQTYVHDEAMFWLEQLDLHQVAGVPVSSLNYGRQRLLEIALALACRPRVLLLDEPAAGLSVAESHAMLDVLKALPDEVSILLVEHDMNLVFGFARTISVMARGTVIAHGAPHEIRADPRVQAVYLGQAPAQ